MIILYSTECPLCKTLEMKLNQAGISYTKNTDTEEMERLGFQSVPVLYAKEKYFTFSEAMNLINAMMKGLIMPEEENLNENQHQTG